MHATRAERAIQFSQRPRGIADEGHSLAVVSSSFWIGIDVDDSLHARIARARRIRLADKAGTNGDQEIGFLHRVVAANRPFAPADGHVARMVVRQNPRD